MDLIGVGMDLIGVGMDLIGVPIGAKLGGAK